MRKIRRSASAASALALFLGGAAAAQQAPSDAPPPERETAQIGDIIVTAQKREQLLSDVPQSISVLGGEALEQRQARTIADYAALVPGLSFESGNPGQTRVVLRGINAGGASPTVAVYLDDTPFGSSTGQTNGATLAGDFDTFDIERLEVLRGPQGTLYGANSLGGVVKYVTVAPRLGEWEARGQGGVETVRDGGTGYYGNALVNVPLGDAVAVRASGFYRRTAGYIDSIGIADADVNRARSYGGRASLLLKPSDRLSLRLTAVLQNIDVDSRNAFDADAATLRPITADPFTGARTGGRDVRYQLFPDRNEVSYRLYTGTLDYDLGFASLTSVTSYSRQVATDRSDVSYNLLAPGVTLAQYASSEIYGLAPDAYGMYYPNRSTQKKFTQELRLASKGPATVEWLVGGYYTREPGQLYQRYYPFDTATGRPVTPVPEIPGFNGLVLAQLDSTYKEFAGFGSATLHLSDKFDLTAGGRYSHNDQRTTQTLDGILFGGPSQNRATSKEGVFTWSVSPRYEFAPHSEVYARVAKGYRPGGPNVVPPGAGPDYPLQTDADTLMSYEAGIRAETADRTFGIDLSGYYLDWDKTLIVATFQTDAGPISADANGEGARSYGVEATATLRPTRGFTVTTTVAYNNTGLRGDTSNGGRDGDQLPFAPTWNANVSAEYSWDWDGARPYVGADVSTVSDRLGNFDATYRDLFGRRITFDGYTTASLRAGVSLGRFDLSVHARNIGNSRGLISAGTYPTRPNGAIEVSPIQPRTIGATLGVGF
ncbi:outer membrane receptor protein involved in Fe transport [Sphingomonas endophytica]|uniref:Outer membrane receptor protein involved in Fe transport n=1 Tax=Sphingomonas endophytica TaxID=869719 RepID=A0A7X0JBJ4_9SPHN|nr:TonB-dependent receptor [Sphingomonas endophytica]MBB6504584.1 outer membrane receptor protein involved in Fe transport [Sphingomonas endophytica]